MRRGGEAGKARSGGLSRAGDTGFGHAEIGGHFGSDTVYAFPIKARFEFKDLRTL